MNDERKETAVPLEKRRSLQSKPYCIWLLFIVHHPAFIIRHSQVIIHKSLLQNEAHVGAPAASPVF
jgi:hypothetical protein